VLLVEQQKIGFEVAVPFGRRPWCSDSFYIVTKRWTRSIPWQIDHRSQFRSVVVFLGIAFSMFCVRLEFCRC
jgi:hypothetical protein